MNSNPNDIASNKRQTVFHIPSNRMKDLMDSDASHYHSTDEELVTSNLRLYNLDVNDD